MKIHLIRTPEYDRNDLEEVHQILNSFSGPMKFKLNNFEFDKKNFYFLQEKHTTHANYRFESDIRKKMFKTERGFPLSWEELFLLCETYRKKKKIPKKDFIFLITHRNNTMNWFSHCNKERNGFIHAGDWEKFNVKVHHKFPVAYGVVENVLQTLMEINSENGLDECIHYQSQGCINDFCHDKRQVILKLRTADICESCLKRIQEMAISMNLVDQIFQILEGLRAQFLFRKGINRIAGPYSLIVDENYNLYVPQLGNKQLLSEPLFRTLYIFLLQNPEGILLKDLMKHRTELIQIYSRLSPYQTKREIEKRINDLSNPLFGSFSQKKSKINRNLKNLLGDTIAESFLISGKRGTPFKINLSPENIDIRF